jgi:PilZ domain
MVAGTAGVDYPDAASALSVLPLGADQALTSRVRRVTDSHLVISPPRDGTGGPAVLVARDLLELSWQADDGLRSVSADVVDLTADSLWRVRVRGPASRIQRRDWVRAPIGLPVWVSCGRHELAGSTVDLSEGGLDCVLRPDRDQGPSQPAPRRGEVMRVTVDLYSDVVQAGVQLTRRVRREDGLLEWSLEFLDLPEPAADLIRSHVFTALRNARARDLRALY